MKLTLLLISIFFFYISGIESKSFCKLNTNGTSSLSIDLSPLAGYRGHASMFDNRTRTHYNLTYGICEEFKCSNHTYHNGSVYCNNATLCQYGKNNNISLGKIESISIYNWGFLANLSNGDVINGTRRNATFFVHCDKHAFMNITSIFPEENHIYAYFKSRFACPTFKPSVLKICTKIAHNNCLKEDCCYSQCNNGTKCSCKSNFGAFNASLHSNKTIEIEVESSNCGNRLTSSITIFSVEGNYYNGSSSFNQRGNMFMIQANATYIVNSTNNITGTNNVTEANIINENNMVKQ